MSFEEISPADQVRSQTAVRYNDHDYKQLLTILDQRIADEKAPESENLNIAHQMATDLFNTNDITAYWQQNKEQEPQYGSEEMKARSESKISAGMLSAKTYEHVRLMSESSFFEQSCFGVNFVLACRHAILQAHNIQEEQLRSKTQFVKRDTESDNSLAQVLGQNTVNTVL